MYTSTIASMPWTQGSRQQRTSFTSRVSGFLSRRGDNASSYQSPRATTTFEVPLFLSPTRYNLRNNHEHVDVNTANDGPGSPQAGFAIPWARSTNIASSSVYSSPALSHALTALPDLPARNRTTPANSSQSDSVTESNPTIKQRRAKHQHRRRKTSLKRQVQTSKHLSLAFGITFLLTIIIYLILAVTGIASGTIFHITLIFLLLTLFGIFLHSSIRWVVFSRRRKEKRRQKTTRGQWYGNTNANVDLERGDRNHADNTLAAEHVPGEPIHIIMKEDEVTEGVLYDSTTRIQQPPPTYGNVRDSKRIDPNLVQWKQVPPSPLTPTYSEAMQDVHRAVGYRPPSYIASDCGTTQIIEIRRMNVEGMLHHIHPLRQDT